MFTLAVLMTCYNRVAVTRRCLQRLFRCPLPENWRLAVWLVDDASPDRTGDIVVREFPAVHVIQSPGNLFWCKGMRLAWDTAAAAQDYDAYLWLNDDVMLFEDAFRVLARDLDRMPNARESVFMGACQSGEDDSAISYSARLYDKKLAIPNGESPQPICDMMSGNFVFVPRAVFRKVGPIYGGYWHGCGDHDYALMCERAGIMKYCCSKAVGVCPRQPERYLHLKDRTLAQRIKLLFTPKGYPLHDTIIFRYRNNGILRVIVSFFHVLAVVIFAIEPMDAKLLSPGVGVVGSCGSSPVSRIQNK